MRDGGDAFFHPGVGGDGFGGDLDELGVGTVQHSGDLLEARIQTALSGCKCADSHGLTVHQFEGRHH